jgi:ankyrin repeat protein
MIDSNRFRGPVFWIPIIFLSLVIFGGLSWIDMRSEPTLHQIAAGGNVKLLTRNLAAGAEVDALDENGFSPLHHAILEKADSAVAVLMAAGADINRATSAGSTPLHLAVTTDNASLVETLLAAGADFNALTPDGASPLCLAVDKNSPLVNSFLQAGAVPDADACAVGDYLFCAASSGCIEMLEELIVRGLDDVNRFSAQGASALHHAVYGGHLEAVRLLIKNGADVNALDKRRWTPLHQAVRSGRPAMVRSLIESGADMELRDHRGCTPLLMAARVGHLEEVQVLAESGANLDAADDEKHTVMDLARSVGRPEICVYIDEYRRTLALRQKKAVVGF